MKKLISFLFLISVCGGTVPSFAGQPIDVDLQERPIGELFDLIGEQTSRRIYAPMDPELFGMRVTVNQKQTTPAEILRQVLSGSPFQVTEFKESLFILRGRMLVTTVADPVYVVKGDLSNSPGGEESADNFRLARQETAASSDVRIYEVGDPDATGTGRVTMNGYVFDAQSDEPVAGVIVNLEGTFTAAMTDAFGYYTLSLTPGDYMLNILGAGQEDTQRHIKLHSEGRFDILTTEKIYTFVEISVYGERRDNVRQTTIGVERLRMDNIRNIPTAPGESDIMRIVAMLPGVKTAGEVSSGFNVRGGATDQNLILYNGGTIYNPNHLFGMFSAFNPDIVRDMELYKSSIPAKFGGRISSVLDINSREGNKKKIEGSASIGLLTSRLMLKGPLKREKTSFIVGGALDLFGLDAQTTLQKKRLPRRVG